jgi:PilZ domain-containing protein
MLERRLLHRSRVYYGGMIAFNARNSTLDCVVRNFSPHGAKIEFENSAILPDRVDFEVVRKGLSCRARLAWRDHNTAGWCSAKSTRRAMSLRWTGRANCAPASASTAG